MNGKCARSNFVNVDLGDKRLNDRLVKHSEDFIKTPESLFSPGTLMFCVV